MNQNKIRFHTPGREYGSAMMELVIVLPLLIAICFGALQVSMTASQNQVVTTLSKELASVAYRECIAPVDATTSVKFNPNTCLQNILDTYAKQSLVVAPLASYVVTLYTMDNDGITVKQVGQASWGLLTSRYSVSTFSEQSPRGLAAKQVMSGFKRVMVAEVNVPNIYLLFSHSGPFGGGGIYASTAI